MIRKVLLAFVLLALFCAPLYAGAVKNEIISSVTLDKTSTVTGDYIYTGDAKRVSFFVSYDSSDATTGVTVSVTASFSYDGVNWTPACWYDTNGGVTPQTEEILSSDGTYAGWFPNNAPVPYIRIGIRMDNAEVYGLSETGTVTVKIVKDE